MVERKRNEKGMFITEHGKINTSLYSRWRHMKERCNNPNMPAYVNYGGRGIKMCKEWEESFESFYSWAIENGFQEGLSIDRIDNNKGYFPDNCRWITKEDQNRNKRSNRKITYNGETKCISEWASISGVDHRLLRWRINNGWPVERALETKDHRLKEERYERNRETETIAETCC